MGLLDGFDIIMDHMANRGADLIERERYERNCLPKVDLQRCITWAKKSREHFPQSMGFIISVKQNASPKNENDNFVVTLAMLDNQNQLVHFDEVKAVSTVFHAKTIDNGILNLLNGTDSAILKF